MNPVSLGAFAFAAVMALSTSSAQSQSARPGAGDPLQGQPPTPGVGAPPQAQPQAPGPKPAPPGPPPRQLFRQLKLLGTYAVNCSNPVGPRNPYLHFRELGTANVQVELMVGPKKRQFAYVIDRARISGPTEVSVSMTDQRARLHVVYHVEDGSIRIMESMREPSDYIISEGQAVASGNETQWFKGCGD
jgi:hypothetical protein